jgi:hypothetical protein
MIPLNAHAPTTLEWKQQSAFGRFHELKGGDTVYAAVEFVKRFGSLAEARTAGGAWTYKRRGMMSPAVSARAPGSETDVAVYKPNWSSSKGELTLASGEKLQFRSESFWGKDWLLITEAGQPLLRFATRGVMKHGAEVTLEPACRERADLPLLITFCWYLLLLYIEDMSGAAVLSPGG